MAEPSFYPRSSFHVPPVHPCIYWTRRAGNWRPGQGRASIWRPFNPNACKRAHIHTYTHTHHLWLPFCQVHNCGITLPPLTPPDVVGYSTCRCECRCEWCVCLACCILIFNFISNCNKMAAASPSFQLTTTAATLSFHGLPLALRADRTQSWPPVSDIL